MSRLTGARRQLENGLYRLHWLGKIRGLPFDPMHFRIDRLDSPDVVTVEGDRVKMPVMSPVDEEAVEAREETFAKRDLALMKAMAADPTGSECKWSAAIGMPKTAVHAALGRLKRDRLVDKKARRWGLTKTGERVVKEGEKPIAQNGPDVGPASKQQSGPVSRPDACNTKGSAG
jgi:hypothetical protein